MEEKVSQKAEDEPEIEPDKTRLRHAGAAGLSALNPERAPSASELHGEGRAKEHIGRVIISAEANETRAALSELSETKVLAMPIEDLLRYSEKIAVGGSNLRRIYETNLIGEGGLRRLVLRFMRQEDLSVALRGEILEHEKDFERDPAIRDLPSELPELDTSARTTLEKIFGSLSDEPDLGMTKPKSSSASKKRIRELKNTAQHSFSRLDLLLGLIIVILLLLIIFLLLTKH